MENDINESIDLLNKEIEEKKLQLELIYSIDWTNKVDEDTWHNICETPLRYRNILEHMVKNIFEDATDIKLGSNYVFFNLYGFKCGLPTSRCRGVYIDTSWYEKDYGRPKWKYTNNSYNMKKYFDALDNKLNWDILFQYRLPKLCYLYNKPTRFILWFFKYKWKKIDRDKWEDIFKTEERNYELKLKMYTDKRTKINNKTRLMASKLIPMLNTFSNNVYRMQDYSGYTIEDICKFENVKLK